ncbi:MAG: type IX secretion system membrane protein PorP/SprF [Crocinitomicaceae bacterium]|nr:type IX secretion system membrane protein PorP/SprF [Crocinitomicaceae bacterium]
MYGHYRNQWLAVATKPFTTGLISFDANKGKWGYGAQIANFRAGTGGYNVISFMPSAAYKFVFGQQRFSFISVGAQVGVFQKSINSSSLTFGTNTAKTNGGEFNTALSTNENFGNSQNLQLRRQCRDNVLLRKPTSMINPFEGVSLSSK